MMGSKARGVALGAAGLAMLCAAVPAAAQSDTEVRLKKVESEVKALQRKVFPGADGKFFEPEITPPAAQVVTPTGTPSTTAVTDILARLDALEGQLQRLTANNEENANALRLLQDRVKILESAGAAPAQTASLPPATTGAPAAELAAKQPAAAPATKPAGPSAERLAAVQAIAKPSSDDPGADDYNYGFRLWDAKLYPEAEQQLTLYVEKYPEHAMISYGRNLLGRAYLDDGKPREAAPWFLKNYQSDKNGARAGDSLLFLAESMIGLKDTKRACIALAEFSETYPALATGRLKSQFDTDRKSAKCK